MANPNDTLPEGTDSIIDGAGRSNDDGLAGRGNQDSISGTRSGSETGTTSGDLSGADAVGGVSGTSGTSGGSGGNATGATSGSTSTGGGTVGGGTGGGGTASGGTTRERAVETLRSGTEKLSGQAAEKARGLVSQGLERGGEALANVSKLIGDTAAGLDERLGPQYGDYARKAATTIEETASRFAAKDADELIEDTRDFVRKSPGVALAGAAVLGFALVRLVKSGLDQDGAESTSRGDGNRGDGNRSGGSRSGGGSAGTNNSNSN